MKIDEYITVADMQNRISDAKSTIRDAVLSAVPEIQVPLDMRVGNIHIDVVDVTAMGDKYRRYVIIGNVEFNVSVGEEKW